MSIDNPSYFEQKYLETIILEIEKAKALKKHGIYKINTKIGDNTAKYIKRYFENNSDYDIDIKKCMSCIGTWDILITFRNI